MKGGVVTIPESILCTIIFPKIIDAFITRGPGDCYKGLRNSGCGVCHISKRTCAMLNRSLPKCGEPNCRNPAVHVCDGGQPICCVHCARFGFMHQQINGTCLCTFNVDRNYDPVYNWIVSDDDRNVSVGQFNEMLFLTFWDDGSAAYRYNLTYGRFKDVHLDKSKRLIEYDPMIYICLLYGYVEDVDVHIFKFKNPTLAKKWKKIKK